MKNKIFDFNYFYCIGNMVFSILEKSFNAASNNPLQDVNDFLKDMPTELLSDSSSFLSDTLKLAHLFGSKDDEFENRELNSVIDSQREVSIPPGFGNDPETKHVEEINEKLAHYQIETDTGMIVE